MAWPSGHTILAPVMAARIPQGPRAVVDGEVVYEEGYAEGEAGGFDNGYDEGYIDGQEAAGPVVPTSGRVWPR